MRIVVPKVQYIKDWSNIFFSTTKVSPSVQFFNGKFGKIIDERKICFVEKMIRYTDVSQPRGEGDGRDLGISKGRYRRSSLLNPHSAFHFVGLCTLARLRRRSP